MNTTTAEPVPSTHKAVTKEAVLAAVEELFRQSVDGSTTTLDVKNYLRDKMYWANQREVRGFMRELANEKSWATSHGAFTTYSIDVQPAAAIPTVQGADDTTPVKSTPTSPWNAAEQVKALISEVFNISLTSGVIRDTSRFKADLGLNDKDLQLLKDAAEKKFSRVFPDFSYEKVSDLSSAIEATN